jgi:hypothetical protein
MTSYRTLVFGSIAMICATAPALADSVHAMPGPVTTQSITAVGTMDSVHAMPAPVTQNTTRQAPAASAPQSNQGFTLGGLLKGLHIPGANLILQYIQH